MAKVLFLFCMKLEEKNECREFPFVKLMEVKRPKDAVGEALKCICCWWNTLDVVDYSRKDLGTRRNRKRLRVGDWFGVVHQKTFRSSRCFIRCFHTIEPSTAPILLLFRRFSLNRFSLNGYL